MRSKFPLFQSHLDVAHNYWHKLLNPGDIVVDATCGNGNDTLALAQMVLTDNSGSVYGFDLQAQAIENTKKLLDDQLPASLMDKIHLMNQSHDTFPEEIATNSVKLIVYNLGYLPKGNKEITTEVKSTLVSLKNAMQLIANGGAISITCYPGHPEGQLEETALLNFVESLDPKEWNCSHQRIVNRQKAPSLLLIQRCCE